MDRIEHPVLLKSLCDLRACLGIPLGQLELGGLRSHSIQAKPVTCRPVEPLSPGLCELHPSAR